MIGESPAFREFVATLAKVAAYDAPVLIEGETGTGKELAARAIHYGSSRRAKAFVPVNCGALPDTLIENELFGHCRGAYTHAATDQPGLVELAQGGTLLLDEVDALSPKGQVTLLRFLQDQQFRPLGARVLRDANVRVVAACNRCLETLARRGEFRPDLLYRLRFLSIRVPPVRQRDGDAVLLAEHFVRVASARYGKAAQPLAPAALAWLARHDWPGNVRELENVVVRAFLMSDGPSIVLGADSDADGSSAAPPPEDYRSAKHRAIAAFERSFLARAIERASGNVSEAARMIGTERRHLGRLLKKHRLARIDAER